MAVNFKGSAGGVPGVPSGGGGPIRKAAAAVHDLSLDMRMDPETAATIRTVSDMKERAVASEDYETVNTSQTVLQMRFTPGTTF